MWVYLNTVNNTVWEQKIWLKKKAWRVSDSIGENADLVPFVVWGFVGIVWMGI